MKRDNLLLTFVMLSMITMISCTTSKITRLNLDFWKKPKEVVRYASTPHTNLHVISLSVLGVVDENNKDKLLKIETMTRSILYLKPLKEASSSPVIISVPNYAKVIYVSYDGVEKMISMNSNAIADFSTKQDSMSFTPLSSR